MPSPINRVWLYSIYVIGLMHVGYLKIPKRQQLRNIVHNSDPHGNGRISNRMRQALSAVINQLILIGNVVSVRVKETTSQRTDMVVCRISP